MIKSLYAKSLMINMALDLLPPILRETLLEDTRFLDEYNIKADAEISYYKLDVNFKRSELYDAIRKCLSDSLTIKVSDKEGEIWEVRNISNEEGLPKLLLTMDDKTISLSNFALLSPDSTVRINWLNKVTSEVNLPSSDKRNWGKILLERALNDDELNLFEDDINDTVVQQMRLISSALLGEQFDIYSLVPNTRKYFERLVGIYDGSVTIQDYASKNGKNIFDQLSSWQPYDGFLNGLLLSSHSALTEEINVDQLSNKDIERAFGYIEAQGDRLSQLGAIEVGLRILKSRPGIEPILVRLINNMTEASLENESKFNLIFSLFVLVDGELSRMRLFISEPPFYRRLAAFSHAALINRQLINTGIDLNKFCEWALEIRGNQFYLQSLLDLRVEPRWIPEFAEPSQIKCDFYGRVLLAANNYNSNITHELFNQILGSNNKSIIELTKFPHSFYAGPLEGTRVNFNKMPEELSNTILSQLSTETITPASFTPLINSTLIYEVENNLAELATKALEKTNYQLSNVKDSTQLLSVFNGLAIIAAGTKNSSLTKALRILVRKYRQDPKYEVSIDSVIRLCIMSAASKEEIIEWCNQVGDWLTELAFSDLTKEEGEILYSRIHTFCDLIPTLWITCGRADAAILAFNAQN